MSQFQQMFVVEFKHSDGWTAAEGHTDMKAARKALKNSKEVAPGFEYRIRRYGPSRQRKPR